jgi:hypothetical protein
MRDVNDILKRMRWAETWVRLTANHLVVEARLHEASQGELLRVATGLEILVKQIRDHGIPLREPKRHADRRLDIPEWNEMSEADQKRIEQERETAREGKED